MTVASPNGLAFEKAAIAKAQALTGEMAANLEGLELLNRAQARLEAEIRDACAAIETFAKLRAELWLKQEQDFSRSESISQVGQEGM